MKLIITVCSTLCMIGLLSGCSHSTESAMNVPSGSSNQSSSYNSAVSNDVPAVDLPTANQVTSNNQANASSNQTATNATSQTSTGNASVSPGNTASPTNQQLYPSYLVPALTQIANTTKVPTILAPTTAGVSPIKPFAGVKESASTSEYNVTVFSTPSSVPVNDPSLDKLPGSSMIGTFEGITYASADNARTSLRSDFDVSKVGVGTSFNGHMTLYSTGKTVKTGIAGIPEMPINVVEWSEGKWKIDLMAGPPSLDLKHESQEIYDEMKKLPKTFGDGHILISQEGNHSLVQGAWIQGNTFYLCQSYESSVVADWISSMTPYHAPETSTASVFSN